MSILGLSPLIRWNPYILGGCTLCPSRPAYLGIPPLRGALVLDEDPVRPKTQTWGQVGKSCPRYRSMMVYVPGYTLGMRQDRCIRVLLSDLFGHWHFGSRCGCRPGWSETKINSAWSCQVDLIVFSPQNKTNSASVALIGWLFQLRLVLYWSPVALNHWTISRMGWNNSFAHVNHIKNGRIGREFNWLQSNASIFSLHRFLVYVSCAVGWRSSSPWRFFKLFNYSSPPKR